MGRGIGSGIGGGTKPRPGATSSNSQRPGIGGGNRPRQNNFVGNAPDDDYGDEDEGDFAEEAAQHQAKQRQ